MAEYFQAPSGANENRHHSGTDAGFLRTARLDASFAPSGAQKYFSTAFPTVITVGYYRTLLRSLGNILLVNVDRMCDRCLFPLTVQNSEWMEGRRPDSRYRAASQSAAGVLVALPGVVALPESRSTPGYISVTPLGFSVCGFADR